MTLRVTINQIVRYRKTDTPRVWHGLYCYQAGMSEQIKQGILGCWEKAIRWLAYIKRGNTACNAEL